MPTQSTRDRDLTRVPPASELLAELGGSICPSLSGMLERLIDRQAIEHGKGARP